MSSVTDFHTHILPCVDDGSQSMEQSLQMLSMQIQQGVGRVVLTPHFYPQYQELDEFLQQRDAAFEALQAAVKDLPQCPNLYLGAEVHYYAGMSNSEELRRLTVGNTPYILVEMPVRPWNDRDYRELEQIHRKLGLIPIIAHLDRYLGPFRTKRIFRRLEALPVKIQVNTTFFTEKATCRKALRYLQAESIHFIGSDCHSTEHRKPNMKEATDRIYRGAAEQKLAYLQSQAEAVFCKM